MKKSLFFMPLVAALAFTSCSSDEPLISDNGFDGTYDGQAYMRVRIAMPDGVTARAEGDTPTFVNGTPEEQAIKEIGLKFYNADGSFYGYGIPVEEATVTPTTPTTDNNVEGTVNEAVIVLQINSNAPKPTHVVAYVNCGDSWKSEGSEPNINEIDKIKPSITTKYGDTYYYAMTSSNYNNVSGTGVATFTPGYQTQIDPESFKPTEDEAIADGVPVDIYVERLAAKVKVNTATADMKASTVTNGEYTLDFVIDGYSLGGTNIDSYYIKHVSDQWNATSLWEGWNSTDLHRCYWSMDMNYNNAINNPPTLDYVSYNEVRSGLPGTKTDTWMYTAENTFIGMAEPKVTTDTKDTHAAPRADDVTELNRYLFQPFAYVIGHYVVKKNGVEVTGADAPYLYECAGKILPEDAMLDYMQQTIGTVLYTRKQISPDKAEYRGVNLKDAGLIKIGSYVKNGVTDASLVCLQWTENATEAELNKYYIKKQNTTAGDDKADSDYEMATTENVKDLLKQSETQAYGFKYDENCGGTGAKGYLAYFPILIKHLNTGARDGEAARGYYGVVRNHCYAITINKITGLGIGIFNPDVDIIPKDKIKPLYLAATFNILSWRVVGQQVDL